MRYIPTLLSLACLMVAAAFVYPVLALGDLLQPRAPGRHHDHLLPATPRSYRLA